MSPNDFRSAFEGMAAGELPPPSDPSFIARAILRRDQRRVRIMAGISLFFWLLGAAGMLVLVLGLDRLVIFLRIADGLPWSFRGNRHSISADQEQMFWGTNLIHHGMPFIEVSIIALALAALFTVLLVFMSWKTTLNRINSSLARIAEELRQTSVAGGAGAVPPPPIPFAVQEKAGRGRWIMLGMLLGIAATVAVVCGIFFSTARLWPGDMAWQGYPRLSPFEAIQWHNQSPQVRIGGNWYELLGIDDVPVEQIIAFSQSRGPNSWQKHFNEDLVELLIRMGHDPGISATLKVRDLSGNVQVLKDIPMTEENRRAIWQLGVQEAPATQPSTVP
jgi:hypothetical protein